MEVLKSRPAFLTGEFICALCLFLAGVFMVIDGLQYPLSSDGVVGPGLMPMVSSLALTAISLTLVWRALQSNRKGLNPVADTQSTTDEDGVVLSLTDFAEEDGEVAGKPSTVAGILGMLVLSVLWAPTIGLIQMLGVLVFVCVFVFEREKLLTAILMSLGSMVVSWLLFVKLFEVPVPVGTLWHLLGI